ncbi:hypothetical protein HVE01_19100 [Vreelandella venusta]|nr:hypothetical protein HVE01_19100 [Halomonas venusta]
MLQSEILQRYVKLAKSGNAWRAVWHHVYVELLLGDWAFLKALTFGVRIRYNNFHKCFVGW